MDAFRSASHFTDADSDVIRKAAATILRDVGDETEAATALFAWVQDHAAYALGLFAHTASETLLNAYGSCTNKANLFVALARASGLAAGFRVMVVDAQEYLGPPAVPRLKPLLGAKSLHVYAAVQVEERWLDADPSDDVRLSLCGEHVWPQVRRVRFDGRSHARLNLDPAHVVEPASEILPDVDHILRKTPTKGSAIITAFNDYTDFMRRRLVLYDDCVRVFDDFMEWYREAHPERHDRFVQAERAYLSARNGAAAAG